MRLYNKKDFLKLPEGTVYFDKPYEKDGIRKLLVGNMHIKGESLKSDFCINSDINASDFKLSHNDLEHDYFWNKIFEGEDVDLDFECGYCNGMYDDDDQYYVLNKNEVKEIIKVLTEAYNMAYKNKQE